MGNGFRNFSQNFITPNFPLDLYLVGGSQADEKNNNFLYLRKYSNLNIINDEDLEEETPILSYTKTPLFSGTNRIKTMNHLPICALMNDSA